MASTLLAALALMLVFEGVIPFLFPARWREIFRRIIGFSDGQIRFFGLISVVVGILVFLASGLI